MGAFVPAAIKARSGQVAEDIDLHIYPIQYRDGESGDWCLTFAVSLMYSRSRGRVQLTAKDPAATLRIDHNYCGDPGDLEALCDGARGRDRVSPEEMKQICEFAAKAHSEAAVTLDVPPYCMVQGDRAEQVGLNVVGLERHGYTATRHQHEVGTGYFDQVSEVISGGKASTLALQGSTETAQFH